MSSSGIHQQFMNFNHISNGHQGFNNPNGHRLGSPTVPPQQQIPFSLNGNVGTSHQPSSQMGYNPNGVGLMHQQGALGFNHSPSINGGGPSNHHHNPPFFDNPLPNNNPGFQQPMMTFNQGMSGMGMNNFNPAYAQMVQDAMRSRAPVGAFDDDQSILVEVLYQSTQTGCSYRRAIESLHGRNNHSASLWKDYYLDHKTEIDRLVAARASPPVIGIQRPSIQRDDRESYGREGSQAASTSSASKQRSQPIPAPKRSSKPAASTPSDMLKKTASGRRHTINSLTTHTPVFDEKNPPPANEIVIPTPPSRSPTPPTTVIPGPRGNKYTPEDRDYFIKFIGWRLKCDPSLSKQELCELLAEKVPHHTAGSWASHWGTRHELADRILSAAEQESADGDAEEDAEEEDVKPKLTKAARNPRKRPNYTESTSDGEDSSSSTDADASGSDDDEDPDYQKPRTRPNRGKGSTGVPFTDEDLKNMVEHVATLLPDWDGLSRSERWRSFTDKYPKRSEAAWAEHFRHRSDRVLSLAKKARGRTNASQPSQSHSQVFDAPAAQLQSTSVQLSSNSPGQESSTKRKHSMENGGERGKRLRDE